MPHEGSSEIHHDSSSIRISSQTSPNPSTIPLSRDSTSSQVKARTPWIHPPQIRAPFLYRDSHSAYASTTNSSSSQTTTISTSGATTTGDAVRSDHTMKSRMWAIVGGVLGGLAALALPIGLVLCIRRGQHRAASSIEQEKELSPFMTPHPPNFISDSEAQGAVGGRRTITAAAMSKSGSHSGSRTTQRGGGISDALPKRSINDTDTYQAGGTLPNTILAQIGDAVREEFAAVLRMQATHFQGSRQGSSSVIDEDNDELPPDYLSERGEGGG